MITALSQTSACCSDESDLYVATGPFWSLVLVFNANSDMELRDSDALQVLQSSGLSPASDAGSNRTSDSLHCYLSSQAS